MMRMLAAYAAMAAPLFSLAWLSYHLEQIPTVVLRSWDNDSSPLIVLDAGHGGHDGGAVVGKILEKQLALDLTQQLRTELIEKGLRVKMTRDSDVFIPLEERAALANEAEAAAFISLHLNTSSNTEVSGIETYYAEKKPLRTQRILQAKWGLTTGTLKDQRGKWLADCLQKSMCLNTQAVNRGIKERNYAVVSQTTVPSVLIECGFLTHETEANRLQQEGYQKQLISGITQGVLMFINSHHRQPSRGLIHSADAIKIEEAEENTPP